MAIRINLYGSADVDTQPNPDAVYDDDIFLDLGTEVKKIKDTNAESRLTTYFGNRLGFDYYGNYNFEAKGLTDEERSLLLQVNSLIKAYEAAAGALGVIASGRISPRTGTPLYTGDVASPGSAILTAAQQAQYAFERMVEKGTASPVVGAYSDTVALASEAVCNLFSSDVAEIANWYDVAVTALNKILDGKGDDYKIAADVIAQWV